VNPLEPPTQQRRTSRWRQVAAFVEAPAVDPQADASQSHEIAVQAVDVELEWGCSLAQAGGWWAVFDEREAVVQSAFDAQALELGAERCDRALE
jgi:hypothetical protein